MAALTRPGVATPPAPLFVDTHDTLKFGCHVSVWFADDEHALLQRVATTTGLTVSGYLGRYVVERWLRARRDRLAKAPETAERRRPT
jgi:hypothetical protein